MGTGAVGQEIINLMEKGISCYKNKLLASPNQLEGKWKRLAISKNSGNDTWFIQRFGSQYLCGSSIFGLQFMLRQQFVVIDNSSAFRMEKDIPLIVPEINEDDIDDKKVSLPTQLFVQSPIRIAAPKVWLKIFCIHLSSSFGVAHRDLILLKNLRFLWVKVSLAIFPESPFPHPCPQSDPHIDVFRDDGYTKRRWRWKTNQKRFFLYQNLKFPAHVVFQY